MMILYGMKSVCVLETIILKNPKEKYHGKAQPHAQFYPTNSDAEWVQAKDVPVSQEEHGARLLSIPSARWRRHPSHGKLGFLKPSF